MIASRWAAAGNAHPLVGRDDHRPPVRARAIAVSEMARRALANQGDITVQALQDGARRGIECICQRCVPSDAGRSSEEFPNGLKDVARLMDEFVRRNDPERTIVMRKWLREAARIPGR